MRAWPHYLSLLFPLLSRWGSAREKTRDSDEWTRGGPWNICQESERSRKVLSVGPNCQNSSRRHEGKQEYYVSPFLSPTLSLLQIIRQVHIIAISLSLTHKEFVYKSVDWKQSVQLTKMDRISVDRLRLWQNWWFSSLWRQSVASDVAALKVGRHADYSVLEYDFFYQLFWRNFRPQPFCYKIRQNVTNSCLLPHHWNCILHKNVTILEDWSLAGCETVSLVK